MLWNGILSLRFYFDPFYLLRERMAFLNGTCFEKADSFTWRDIFLSACASGSLRSTHRVDFASRFCCIIGDYKMVIRMLPHLPNLHITLSHALSFKSKLKTHLFSSAYWSVIFFSLYQPITSTACICSVVCVCDEMSVSICLCKHSGLLWDGAP